MDLISKEYKRINSAMRTKQNQTRFAEITFDWKNCTKYTNHICDRQIDFKLLFYERTKEQTYLHRWNDYPYFLLCPRGMELSFEFFWPLSQYKANATNKI